MLVDLHAHFPDGYIKPALPGLEHLGRMRDLQAALTDRYGAQDAEKIASANALRVLRRAGGAQAPTGTGVTPSAAR
jgi:microsomal dipeptidase-like Zn-dependent dipeptidase